MEDFKFKKAYGQNFLNDNGIVEKIVRETNIEKDSLVIEVGPGELLKESNERSKMEVKKGDNIIISEYAGTKVKFEGQEYIIVKQDDILAIVE